MFLRASLYTATEQADTDAELHGCTAKLTAAWSKVTIPDKASIHMGMSQLHSRTEHNPAQQYRVTGLARNIIY